MERKTKETSWFLRRKDGKSHPLLRGMMFVGRDECDLILQSASADKRHAVIFFDSSDEEIRIKDLNSITGTYVNGMRIPEQTYVKLKHLDSLRFGYGPDVFHIEKSNGSTVQSFVPKQNVDGKLEEFFSGKQPVIKESFTTDDYKMPGKKQTKASLYTKEKKPHLQEADSLEDLKDEVPSSLPEEHFKARDSSSSLPLINPLKLKKSNCNDFLLSHKEDNSCVINSTDNKDSSNKSKLPTSTVYKVQENSDQISDIQCYSEPSFPVQNDIESTDAGQPNRKESCGDNSPAAMAFTVAFDNNVPRKKLSIKDSISKYAPRKTDAERNIPRLKQEKLVEPFIGKVALSENTAVSEPDARRLLSQENAFDDLENRWKVINQLENKKKEGHLSDGASYLIRKMFNGQSKVSSEKQIKSLIAKPEGYFQQQNSSENICKSTKPVVTPLSPKSEKEAGTDDKSETGTYTIEEDLDDDNDVKEARQKIDEVFNVLIPEDMNKASDFTLSKVPLSNNSEKCTVLSPKASKNGNNSADNEMKVNNKSKTQFSSFPIRPKRRLPVPPVQTAAIGNSSSIDGDKGNFSNYGTYSVKNKESYFDPMSKSDVVLREHSPISEKSLIKERISCNPQTTRALMYNRFSSNVIHPDKISNLSPASETLNENSSQLKTLSSGINWRRFPWNLSGSDLELDQNRIETSSVLSDVSASTEPPSLATEKKLDHTPLMKFNRAFNLRRARLGLDIDVANCKNLDTKESHSKNQRNSSHLAPVISTLSRQDGGRFSLRLPKSTTKPGISKGNCKTNKQVGSTALKTNHRRNDSDPGKTAFLQRDAIKSSPNHQQENSQSSFQRCSSFCSDSANSETELFPRRASPQKLIKRQDTITLDKHRHLQKQQFGDCSISCQPTELGLKHKEHNLKVSESEHSARRICQNGSDARGMTKGHISREDHHGSKNPYKVASLQKQKHELSALDSLVISAIHQLSRKLREKAHLLLEKERNKFPLDSTERLTIEEMLPQVSEKRSPDASAEGISRDLSSVLKNLKRVEQSLEVLAAVDDDLPKDQKTSGSESGFFVVDV